MTVQVIPPGERRSELLFDLRQWFFGGPYPEALNYWLEPESKRRMGVPNRHKPQDQEEYS